MKLEPKHYLVIAGILTGVATQLVTAQHGWSDVATPGFVAGLLIQIASAITAIFVGAPGATDALTRANQNTDMANATTRALLADPIDMGKVDPKRFVGTGTGDGMKVPMILLALCLVGGSIACAPAVQPVNVSPQAVRAQQAQQVIQRIGELQQAVIDGQQLGKIKTEDARVIVTWTVASLKALRDAPQGWVQSVATGWTQVRPMLLRDPNLSIWVSVVDQLIQGGW